MLLCIIFGRKRGEQVPFALQPTAHFVNSCCSSPFRTKFLTRENDTFEERGEQYSPRSNPFGHRPDHRTPQGAQAAEKLLSSDQRPGIDGLAAGKLLDDLLTASSSNGRPRARDLSIKGALQEAGLKLSALDNEDTEKETQSRSEAVGGDGEATTSVVMSEDGQSQNRDWDMRSSNPIFAPEDSAMNDVFTPVQSPSRTAGGGAGGQQTPLNARSLPSSAVKIIAEDFPRSHKVENTDGIVGGIGSDEPGLSRWMRRHKELQKAMGPDIPLERKDSSADPRKKEQRDGDGTRTRIRRRNSACKSAWKSIIVVIAVGLISAIAFSAFLLSGHTARFAPTELSPPKLREIWDKYSISKVQSISDGSLGSRSVSTRPAPEPVSIPEKKPSVPAPPPQPSVEDPNIVASPAEEGTVEKPKCASTGSAEPKVGLHELGQGSESLERLKPLLKKKRVRRNSNAPSPSESERTMPSIARMDATVSKRQEEQPTQDSKQTSDSVPSKDMLERSNDRPLKSEEPAPSQKIQDDRSTSIVKEEKEITDKLMRTRQYMKNIISHVVREKHNVALPMQLNMGSKTIQAMLGAAGTFAIATLIALSLRRGTAAFKAGGTGASDNKFKGTARSDNGVQGATTPDKPVSARERSLSRPRRSAGRTADEARTPSSRTSRKRSVSRGPKRRNSTATKTPRSTSRRLVSELEVTSEERGRSATRRWRRT